MRLLVQSSVSGRFLAPALDGGSPEWVQSLKDAGGGVVFDMETAFDLISEHCDFEDRPQVVDLDRLGTINDY
jgi:hypothetical protein